MEEQALIEIIKSTISEALSTHKSNKDNSTTDELLQTYDASRFPGFTPNPTHAEEEYSYRTNRRSQLDKYYDALLLNNIKSQGDLNNADLQNILNSIQNIDRGDDAGLTFDKGSDERTAKNETNVGAIMQKILTQMEKFNSAIDAIKIKDIS